ncbi:MAG: IS481 family transposase [Gemmatimonadota bacterium]|nr:IS481 family transposase [Gemmatimonadota bacterium]
MRAEVALRLGDPQSTRSALAREYHVSRQTIAKWAFRFASDGVAGLRDRSSRPRRSPRRLARTVRRQVERRRRRRWSSLRIARDLQLPIATVVREQRRLGLAQLRSLDPPRPANRYEWPAAGDLLHLDIKKLGRIGGVGHRIHGDRTRRSRGLGWEAVHVAIDDCTRLAYAEVLADETQETTARFLHRALRYFARRGIQISRVMTDNGSAYRSRCFAAVVAQHHLRHLRTRPYTPRTNGKAERFIRTLLAEWAYAQAYRTSHLRTAALSHYLGYYNTARSHMGIHGATPQQKLATL